MVAKDLLSREIVPLRAEQTGKEALRLLTDHHLLHLPVVEGERLIGLLSEEDIFNHRLADPVGEYGLSPQRVTASGDDHVFELMRSMGENRLSVIPVVDEADKYLGLVSQHELTRFFAQTTSFAEPGSVLVLEMQQKDYSLARLAQWAEAEDVQILTSLVTSTPDSENLEITLKLNSPDVRRVIASFERHGVEVKNFHTEAEQTESLRERYDALMSYLNV